MYFVKRKYIEVIVPKHHSVKVYNAYRESGGEAPPILKLGNRWPVLSSSHFTPWKEVSCTHWTGERQSRFGLGGEEKTPCPFRKLNPGQPLPSYHASPWLCVSSCIFCCALSVQYWTNTMLITSCFHSPFSFFSSVITPSLQSLC